jgi:hypothetical protein
MSLSSCSSTASPPPPVRRADDPTPSSSSGSNAGSKRSGSNIEDESPRNKRPKLATNPIHSEFTFENGYSICKHCKAPLKGKNSTTLETHIRAKHAKIHKIFLSKKEAAVKDIETKKKAGVIINKPLTAASSNLISMTPSVSSMFGRTDTISRYSYQDQRQKKITKDIALLISTTTLPVSVVSSPAFKNLVTDLNPHARVPERKKMRKEINGIWDELKAALKSALDVARRVSITTDIWTSKNLTASYLGITVHFFNPQTRRRGAHKIACREFPNPHTGEMIADKILEICREFGLEDKLDYVTCDNGSNMVASFKFMEEIVDPAQPLISDVFDPVQDPTDDDVINLEEDDEDNLWDLLGDEETVDLPEIDENSEHVEQDYGDELEAQEEEVEREVADHIARDCDIDATFKISRKKRGRCFSHTGQLPINKVNKLKNQAFGRVLVKAKKYVAMYRKSSKAKYVLRKTSFKKRLAGFVKTRWHSDLEMSKSLVEAAEKEDKPLAKLTEAMNWPLEISVADVRMLKLYNSIMEPFANKTNLLGGEKYSTIQLVLPTLMELLNHLEESGRAGGGGVQRYCNKLKSEMEQYFRHVLDPKCSEFDPIYYMATFLDPIFSQVLTPDQNKIAVNALKTRMKEEMTKNGEDWRNTIENVGEGGSDQAKKTTFRGFKHISGLIASAQTSDRANSTPFGRDLELYKAEMHRVLLSRQQGVDESSQPTTEVEPDQIEVDANEAKEEESPIDDPLDYWVMNECKYETILPLIAQDILCIPATSTPSERLFSASGLLSSGVMSNISPDNLEKRVLIKVNVIPGDY